MRRHVELGDQAVAVQGSKLACGKLACGEAERPGLDRQVRDCLAEVVEREPRVLVDGWIGSYLAIASGEASVTSHTIEHLTGQRPMDFAEFPRCHAGGLGAPASR